MADSYEKLKADKERLLAIERGQHQGMTAIIPQQMADDLVRTIIIAAASANVLPPKIIDGKIVEQVGYTAEQHKAIVERCKQMIVRHDLMNWKVGTFDVAENT